VAEDTQGSVGAAAASNPGQVERLVRVMHILLSADGCPWDRSQTHTTLVKHLLEEAYEAAEAIETADRAGMVEELGDVLLQVVFHATIGESDPEPFTLEDVAAGVADKLIGRHPFIFGTDQQRAGHENLSAADTYVTWDQIKTVEKSRTSVLDGIPIAQPALARTQKVVERAQRGGLDADGLVGGVIGYGRAADDGAHPGGPTHPSGQIESDAAAPSGSADIGHELLATVLRAARLGVDAEGALRAACRDLEGAIRHIEAAHPAQPPTMNPEAPDPHSKPNR
jgi:XTP/dITP diphosphohydrolase